MALPSQCLLSILPSSPPPLPDISARCLPASDYLVLGTGYSVLGTRYPVYSPTTTIGEHTAAGRRHPEATAFVPFVLVRLLILPQAGWGIPSSRFLEEEMHRAKTSRAHALYLLPFVFLFFLFLLLSLLLLLLLLRVIVSSCSLVTRILLLASVYPPFRRAGP